MYYVFFTETSETHNQKTKKRNRRRQPKSRRQKTYTFFPPVNAQTDTHEHASTPFLGQVGRTRPNTVRPHVTLAYQDAEPTQSTSSAGTIPRHSTARTQIWAIPRKMSITASLPSPIPKLSKSHISLTHSNWRIHCHQFYQYSNKIPCRSLLKLSSILVVKNILILNLCQTLMLPIIIITYTVYMYNNIRIGNIKQKKQCKITLIIQILVFNLLKLFLD